MFTKLKKGNWNYMLLAAASCVVMAALITLFRTSRPKEETNGQASHNSEQVITGRYNQYNETTLRFIN